MKAPRNGALRRYLKAANSLVAQIRHELQRLNRGGDVSGSHAGLSHQHRVQAFKNALAERYRDDSRCC
jgi:hypothetical protein